MPNPSTITLQLIAGVSNGVCQSQAVLAAGALTLNGALVTGGVAVFDVPRRVVAASSGADAGVILTIAGTDRDGNATTEALTLVNSPASVYTKLDFATVTGVTSSGAAAGNITVGTNGVGSSPWVYDDITHENWYLRVGVSLPGGDGTATYTVEHTYDDPAKIGTSLVVSPQQFARQPAGYVPALAWPNDNLVNRTTNAETGYTDGPIMAHRLTITAGTGMAVMQSIQAGIGNR